jgi:hypothetical protein
VPPQTEAFIPEATLAPSQTEVFVPEATQVPLESPPELSAGFDLTMVDASTISWTASASVFLSSGESVLYYLVGSLLDLGGSASSHTVSFTRTLTVGVFEYVAYVPVNVVVMYRTASRIAINFKQETPVPEQVSNAVVIGVSSACGLIVAILAGACLFIWRKGTRSEDAPPLADDAVGTKDGLADRAIGPEIEEVLIDEQDDAPPETLTGYATEGVVQPDQLFL